MEPCLLRDAVEELHATKMMYGSPNAPYWFVGLEEANGGPRDNPVALIVKALKMHREYSTDGFRPLRGLDCTPELCPKQCHYRRSDNKRSILPCLLSGNDYDAGDQKTWRGYIKILLALADGNFTLDAVKKYQKYHLCDRNNTPVDRQSALLELFPLHCRRQDHAWPYEKLSHIDGLDYLASAVQYRKLTHADRCAKIVSLIETHQPRYVSLASQNDFSAIFRLCSVEPSQRDIIWDEKRSTISSFSRIGNTVVFSGNHPAGTRGLTNEYFRNLTAVASQSCIVQTRGLHRFAMVNCIVQYFGDSPTGEISLHFVRIIPEYLL